MRIIKVKDYDELGKVTTQHLLGQMFKKQGRVNLAITAGKTPLKVYEYLVPEVKEKAYLSHVHYYNFDEIPHKMGNQLGITMSELNELYFEPAEISKDNIHPLNEQNYLEQDERIARNGGLDCILLGIGEDGHYCGNLPNTTNFEDFTSRVDCDEKMKERLSGHFDDPEDIPDYYITMGPRSIMAAEQLVLIADGSRKAKIMKEFLEGKVTSEIPASILKMHPNLTVIMDQEAASLLN